MLKNNYTVLNSHPGRAIGGFTNLYSNYKPGGWYSFYDPETDIARINSKACFPTGTEPGYSWILAPKGGELSSTTLIRGVASMTNAMAMGVNIESSLTGTGTISSASLALVVSLAASLSGSGSVTAAMVGTVQMAASLLGSGSVVAGLSLLANLVCAMSGDGTISANLKGTASLEAEIFVNQSQASVQELVSGVWNAVATDFNTAGTMGEKMNDAGSAGNPWASDPTSNNDPNTFGELVQRTEKKVDDNQALILTK